MKAQILVSIFSSGGHLVQWSGKVSAILVEGRPMKIPVKLFRNPSNYFKNPSSRLAEVI